MLTGVSCTSTDLKYSGLQYLLQIGSESGIEFLKKPSVLHVKLLILKLFFFQALWLLTKR